MITTILVGLAAGLALALVLLIVYLPDRVQYIESIFIEAPITKVFDALRFQSQLMSWSPWPQETQSNCFVRNEDGQIGARTVYAKNGKEFGYQEVTELIPNEKVGFFLKSYVAPFEKEVRLDFHLRAKSENQILVQLFFSEKLRKPHFLIAYFGGIIKWVHQMHLKDLRALKKYAENG